MLLSDHFLINIVVFLIYKEFIDEVFRNLSALPTPEKRYLPKCKSHASRSAAYDLLVELVKGNVENFKCLHCKMMLQHSKGNVTLSILVNSQLCCVKFIVDKIQ